MIAVLLSMGLSQIIRWIRLGIVGVHLVTKVDKVLREHRLNDQYGIRFARAVLPGTTVLFPSCQFICNQSRDRASLREPDFNPPVLSPAFFSIIVCNGPRVSQARIGNTVA